MSLVGNLEDLGLGDILQILSLSRKSGVLSLRSRGREGRIRFQNGQIVQASSDAFRENLGDLLLRQGLVDIATLKQALTIQRQSERPQPIGVILASHFGLSLPAIDALVKLQVEKVVFSLFSLTEGTFSFDLVETDDQAITLCNPFQLLLEQGLNTQWLALEGSRLLDEKRHRGEFYDASPAEMASATEGLVEELLGGSAEVLVNSCSQTLPPGLLLLVDDDDQTRLLMVDALRARGIEVRDFARAGDYLAAVEKAVDAGRRPALIIDLIMPCMDGNGMLGGCELFELVRQRFPDLKVLLLTDCPNVEAERRIRLLGAPQVISKPKKGDIHSEAGRLSLALLCEQIVQLAGVDSEKCSLPLYDIGAELLREIGEAAGATRGKGPESPGLRLLRGMLQELSNPSLGGGITLLALRYASELMNRAVLFLVRDEDIVGLGQFGIENADEMADVRIRRTRIPREADSVFSLVLRQLSAMKVRPGTTHWDTYLFNQLGGESPEQIFLGPIISEGEVVAILYGDNLPEKKPIGDTEALEIFLSQAGLAMEKALLERRLRGESAG